MSMHESCLLVCCPCFNTMKLWTSDPNLHLSLMDTPFCLPFFLFDFFLVRLLTFLFVCFLVCLLIFACHVSRHMLCLPYLSCLFTLYPFAHYLHISFFPLLVSCSCLCVYTHGARTHRAKVRSFRRKQKGCGWKHANMSQAVAISRFRSLALPFGYVLF